MKEKVENINSIKKLVKKYIDVLANNNLNITKIYLYGSFAKGNPSSDSDIDIALISDDFSGNRFFDWERIIPFRRNIDLRIEPVPYRTEDFKRNDPLVNEILANGIEIKF